MSGPLTIRPGKQPGYRMRVDHDTCILCNGSASVALNPTAAVVWSLCDGRRTLNEIILVLLDHYAKSSRKAIASDVIDSIRRMEAKQLLKLRSDAANQQKPARDRKGNIRGMLGNSKKIHGSDGPLLHPASSYSKNIGTLSCRHHAGFFSICSVTLWGLIDLFNQGVVPGNIDFSKTFKLYRNPQQVDNETDLYPLLFKPDTGITRTDLLNAWNAAGCIVRQDHHGHYREYPFAAYNLIVQRYFSLNDAVLRIAADLRDKYRLEPSKTIAVCYRGTDKHKEVKLAEPEAFLAQTEAVLQTHPHHRVLIQTDQQQVRSRFTEHFGDRCFYFDEMPVTEKAAGIHLRETDLLGSNRFEHAMHLLAVTYQVSQCDIIVNHTGNVASWICLFRGSARRVHQFDQQAKLVCSCSIPDKAE